jgi:hypothetical protein
MPASTAAGTAVNSSRSGGALVARHVQPFGGHVQVTTGAASITSDTDYWSLRPHLEPTLVARLEDKVWASTARPSSRPAWEAHSSMPAVKPSPEPSMALR